MSTENYLEVVQTEDGEVLLRRTDTEAGEALVSLRFSPEVRALLGDHLNQVALAMLGAGMQATSQITHEVGEPAKPPVLH